MSHYLDVRGQVHSNQAGAKWSLLANISRALQHRHHTYCTHTSLSCRTQSSGSLPCLSRSLHKRSVLANLHSCLSARASADFTSRGCRWPLTVIHLMSSEKPSIRGILNLSVEPCWSILYKRPLYSISVHKQRKFCWGQ